MIPIEVLQLALTKEKASVRLYKKLVPGNSTIKNLLELLANEEEKHVKMIKNKIRELTSVAH